MTRAADRLQQMWKGILASLDSLSKGATIVAASLAAVWTFHLHEITGEGDLNPELTLTTEVFDYSKGRKVLLVRIAEKNVGKVPILLEKDALDITLQRIPDGLNVGFVDMDRQPILIEQDSLLQRYNGVELEAGTEMRDTAEFIVDPGLYHIEARLDLPDGDSVNDVTVRNVE